MSMHRICPTWSALARTLLPCGALLLCGALSGCQSTRPRDVFAWNTSKGSAGEEIEGGQQRLEAGTTGRSYMLDMAQGRNLEKAGEWDKARDVYRQLKAQYPDRAEPYHRLGVVADRQRRHDEAQRLYTQAVQRAPQNAEIFNDLGYCFYLQGELEKAESALRKAVFLEDDNSRYHNNLGMVLGHQDRYQEALREFTAAGSEADGYYNLAFVYASQEKHDQAKTCFRQALSLNPTHEQAREALASFEQYDDRQPSEEMLVGLDEPTGGVAYVPYVENSEHSLSDTTPTSATGGAGNTSASGVQAAGHSGLPTSSRQTGRVGHSRTPGLLRHQAPVSGSSPTMDDTVPGLAR
jgi:Flp pilus assembly protein TadD